MCTELSALPFLTESLRRLRWCAGDSTSTRQFAPVSSLCAVRESSFVSRDLSWMRKGPIGVTRREALLAAEEAKAAARAAEKARAAEGGKGGGSGRQSREARRRKGSSSRGGVRTARREDEEPEPGEGWEGGARPEEYDGLFDGP